MVTEDDIGKIVLAKSGSGLNGELLGFDSQGRAMVKLPFGKFHSRPYRLDVAPSDFIPPELNQSEIISKLCKIIMDEFPTDDPRYLYAKRFV